MVWNIELPTAEFYTLQSPQLDGLVREVADAPEVALDTETTGLISWKDRPLFWSLSWGKRRICMPADTLPAFHRAFADRYKRWIFANAKYDCHMLANVGIDLRGRMVDTQVMHALLYEEQPHNLEHMGKTLLSMHWKGLLDDWNKRKFPSVGDHILDVFANNPSRLIEYASNDAYVTFKLYEKLKDELERAKTYTLYPGLYGTLWDLFIRTEVPFTRVLWTCERNGLKIDTDYLKSRQGPALEELDRTARDINHLAGYLLNPKSPAQLQDYFFTRLGLKPTKFTKGGKSGHQSASVDASFLEYYADTVPMAKMLLRHRDLEKILGTYIKGVLDRVDPRGYLHTRFNQDVARCLPAGELVLTSRGYLPVEQVHVGDLVVAHTGKPRRVTELSRHAPKPIYRVRLSNGLELRTTGNHPYLAGEGWARADALHVGHKVTVHSDAEQWRPINGWELFSVSSWGRVKNVKTGTVLALQPKGEWGHLKVQLYRNGAQTRAAGDRKDFSVHRLVLEAFAGKEQGETRHLNGIAWDNTIRNLCYGTSSENRQDALRHGTMSQRRAGRTRLSPEDVAAIRDTPRVGQPPSSTAKLSQEVADGIRRRATGAKGEATMFAIEVGVSVTAMSNLLRGKTWVAAPATDALPAADLAEKYGVSEGYIRAIQSGAKWQDEDYIEGSFATFYEATVIEVTIESEEGTYGLTVEEDHSHVTGGVVTHNTGRLSSSDPNMQNWPVPERDEFHLRGAVICEPDEMMMVGDYEALEMRLLASASGEQSMIQIFLNGWDIHMGNASLMYGIPYEDLQGAKKVDKEVKKELDEIAKANLDPFARDTAIAAAHAKLTAYVVKCLTARGDAKTIGFGLNYGMKAGKLAGRLGCTKPEAQMKIDKYMATYPAVTRFYNEAIEQARQSGYAFTLLGRRRFLPEIVGQNEMDRWGAERQAVNTVIQGTAADAAKMAMVNIYESGILEEHGVKMRSQVHDELINTCHKDAVGDLKDNKRAMWAIKEMMEHPFPTDLEVPLSVSIGKGSSWLSAK